jgi:hypothetical protein
MAKSRNFNLNAILLVAASAAVGAGQQVFATKRKIPGAEGEKDTYAIDLKLADGTPVGEDQPVEEFHLSDPASVAKFNAHFDNLPVVKGGYYSYINESGPTNPQIFKTFNPQGLGKIMAQAVQAAHLIMSRGGAEADEMKSILAAVNGYSAIAEAQIAEQKANSLADEIAKLNLTPAQREALLAKAVGTAAPNVPPATVERDEATGASGGGRKRDRNRKRSDGDEVEAEAVEA